MSETPRRTFGSIRETRRNSTFVARGEELRRFRENLNLNYDDQDRLFIFNVTGQGGVGKTTLLNQMNRIVKKHWSVSAKVDDAQEDLPAVLTQIAKDFADANEPLSRLSEMCNLYRQHLQELEADPSAPRRSAGSLGRVLGTGAVIAGRRIPIAGLALDFVDEDVVGARVEKLVDEWTEWKTFVKRRLPNPEEAELVLHPLEVLSPILVEEINDVAARHLVTLFFDTYERLSEYVDPWLRRLLDGDFGELPSEILLVVAGRDPLEQNLWVDYEPLIAEFPLEPFSEEEARLYLARQGVVDERTVEIILRLSGRLPLLLATLARESPDDPDKVGEAIGTAVERFLKWVEDQDRREIALAAALPRRLDRDVLSAAIGEEAAQRHFTWLISNPFVQATNDGWSYHSVVRNQMISHQLRTSRAYWTTIHGRLATYFETMRNGLGLGEGNHWHEPEWRDYELECAYHRLCEAPLKHLNLVLTEFLRSLSHGRESARIWGELIRSAGHDSGSAELERWGVHIQEGLKALDSQEYRKAIQLFDDLIRQEPLTNDARAIAYDWRADLYELIQRFDRALGDRTKAIELVDDKIDYLLSRGWTSVRLDRTEHAANDFIGSCQIPSSDEEVISRRAAALLFVDRLEDALEQCEMALARNPESGTALSIRGGTYQELKRFDESLADFTKAIELEPENPIIFVRRTSLYRELNRYDEALADYARAIELSPNNSNIYGSRARLYAELDRYDEALADFARAIELAPNDALAYGGRAWLNLELKNHDEALTDFTQAIDLEPDNVLAYLSRAWLSVEMKRFDDALADFNRAVELKPNEAFPIRSRGRFHVETDSLEEAVLDFTRAIEMDPADVLVLSDRAKVFAELHRDDEALVDFTRATEMEPSNVSVLCDRANWHVESQRYDEAIADLNRAIILEPENVRVLGSRAVLYMELGQPADALKDFNRALELDSDSAPTYVLRAVCYEQQDHYDAAVADYSRAIAIEPNNDLALRGRIWMLMQLERYKEAQEEFDRLTQKEIVERQSLLNNQGLLHSYLGQYAEALACYQEIANWEEEASVLYNIAVVQVCWIGASQAEQELNRATAALQGLSADYEQGSRHYGLGGLSALTGDFDTALDHLQMAVSLDRSAREWARHDIAWQDLRKNHEFLSLVPEPYKQDSTLRAGADLSPKNTDPDAGR